MRIKSVAVIDDDDKVLDLIEQILKEEGLEVTRAHRAEKLLEIISEKNFDLIISDLMLPGVSGLELLDAIHQRGFDIPFVLITGYASLDSAIRAVNKGAFHYIKKPFNMEEIRLVVSRLAKRRDLQDEVSKLRKEVEGLKERLKSKDTDIRGQLPQQDLNKLLRARQDANRVFSTIEYLGRLKKQGIITDDEFGEYKGRLLKRIV